jgi:exonuclease VII small subunit
METTTRRQSFESAYTNLEQTVRNFSREKLSYEETIKGFKGEIGVLKTSINNHNKEIQSVLEDNRRLQRQHEDDCTARCSLETL